LQICVVLSDLRAGGAQRVIATLSSAWERLGHTVVLATFDQPANDFYKIPSSTIRLTLGGLVPSESALQSLIGNVRRAKRIREVVVTSNPDLVLSFIDRTNILTLVATRGLGIPVVVSERIYPPAFRLSWPWRLFRRLTYPCAAAVVMQTDRGRDWAIGFLPSTKVSVIENPVDDSYATSPLVPTSQRPLRVIAAGRLVYQKGFDLLIKAFANSRARQLGWILRICGAGEELTNLRQLAGLSGVADRVEFPGLCPDLSKEFATAQVFVLSSRSEGFPNVLLEAMASGCAVIAADCASGPAEIITPGVNGVLVKPEKPAALREALDALCVSIRLREKLAETAVHVRTQFGADQVATKWLSLFQRLCDSRE
jgi:GalNAc-alpha-(1->4)-GalNAc-alpha-(1->3)-diNAcBac-PP-undecaprenol alpha-1,4-N-acetyl-D-galactosaminyltransferase